MLPSNMQKTDANVSGAEGKWGLALEVTPTHPAAGAAPVGAASVGAEAALPEQRSEPTGTKAFMRMCGRCPVVSPTARVGSGVFGERSAIAGSERPGAPLAASRWDVCFKTPTPLQKQTLK